MSLLADSEPLNNRFIPLRVVPLQVVEQTATLADHHEEAATGGMVLLVRTEVFGKLSNALAQQSDLHFRAAGVRCVGLVLFDDVRLLF